MSLSGWLFSCKSRPEAQSFPEHCVGDFLASGNLIAVELKNHRGSRLGNPKKLPVCR